MTLHLWMLEWGLFLVGGWTTHLKIWKICGSQIGNLPPIFGVNIKICWNQHLVLYKFRKFLHVLSSMVLETPMAHGYCEFQAWYHITYSFFQSRSEKQKIKQEKLWRTSLKSQETSIFPTKCPKNDDSQSLLKRRLCRVQYPRFVSFFGLCQWLKSIFSHHGLEPMFKFLASI